MIESPEDALAVGMGPHLAAVIKGLRDMGLTVAFAESCTGGALSALLTEVPGSSEVVRGSAVCYQLEAKHKVLGLTDIDENNVVSDPVAKAMAHAARSLFDADIGIGTTGYLDEGHSPEGAHAYWAVAMSGHDTHVHKVMFARKLPRRSNRTKLLLEILGFLDAFTQPKGAQESPGTTIR